MNAKNDSLIFHDFLLAYKTLCYVDTDTATFVGDTEALMTLGTLNAGNDATDSICWIRWAFGGML
jgi:hypothetical protein